MLRQTIQSLLTEGRIKTEEKAKVVAVVWGTELIQFLAALAILQSGQYSILGQAPGKTNLKINI